MDHDFLRAGAPPFAAGAPFLNFFHPCPSDSRSPPLAVLLRSEILELERPIILEAVRVIQSNLFLLESNKSVCHFSKQKYQINQKYANQSHKHAVALDVLRNC